MDLPVIWPHYIPCDKLLGHYRRTTLSPLRSQATHKPLHLDMTLPSYASSQATLSTIPVHQSIESLDPVSFPSVLLHYTTAKMNGRLWKQMKTQLCLCLIFYPSSDLFCYICTYFFYSLLSSVLMKAFPLSVFLFLPQAIPISILSLRLHLSFYPTSFWEAGVDSKLAY